MEFDIDSENSEDSYMCPEYAKDIFDYLKQREVSQTSTPTGYPRGWELFLYGDKFSSQSSSFCCLQEKFVLCNYMPTQPSLNTEMRAILIDWLVEVQVGCCQRNNPTANLKGTSHYKVF